ncbi:MAG TPA: carbon monoxide dehydrogenase subunit G [Nocardioidaceae bacterium]|nr:carbon monoxide dehydrogenase subunit G [Nocardioidaceae bacterium]
MKLAGEAVLNAPVQNVWNALLDPNVLVRSIPGCERLEVTGENAYGLTVNAGVAAIRGTYSGRCELTQLEPLESLMLKAACAGGPGTIAADVKVGFTDNGDGTTLLRYDADAEVGGAIGGVGQRMLTSVSKRMAGEFFGNVEQALTAPAAAPPLGAAEAVAPAPSPEAGAPQVGQAFVAPPRPAAVASGDFMKGLLVGGGLVLAGVVAGALAARRRG